MKIFKSSAVLLATVLAVLSISSTVMSAVKSELFVQMGHSKSVRMAVFSEDGRYLVTAGNDRTVKLWNVDTGLEIRTFEKFSFKSITDDIRSVGISKDGKYVLSGDSKGIVKIWDAVRGKEIGSYKKHWKVSYLRFSDDQRHVISIGSELKVWDADTGQDIKEIKNIVGLDLSPSSRYVLSGKTYGAAENIFTVYDIETLQKIYSFKANIKDTPSNVAFSPDGKYCLLHFRNSLKKISTVDLWNTQTGKKLYSLKQDKDIDAVAISPDGKYGLFAGKESVLFDLYTSHPIKKLTNQTVYFADFSPDAKQVIYSEFFSSLIALWDIDSSKIVRTFTGRAGVSLNSMDVTSDGRLAITGGDDGKIRLWDISTGQMLKIMDIPFEDGINTVAISPGGKYGAVGGFGLMQLWDLQTSTLLKTWDLNRIRGLQIPEYLEGSTVTSLLFSSDNRYLALSQGIGNIVVIEIKTGKIQVRLKGEPTGCPLFLSPDGKYLINSVAPDTLHPSQATGHAIIWDIENNRQLKKFDGKGCGFFSPDSKYLLYGQGNLLTLQNILTGKTVKTYDTRFLVGHLGVGFWEETFGDFYLPEDKYDKITLYKPDNHSDTISFEKHVKFITDVRFIHGGRHVLSSSHDGTMRLWDIETDREIAQFIGFKDGEWIAITPEGYFNASPNGGKHLNVTLGNAAYSIDNFYEKFFNPVYVASVLQGKKVEGVVDIREGFALPPEVQILSPKPNVTFSTDTISITVAAKDAGGGIDEIRLYHNDKVIGDAHRAINIVSKDKYVTRTYTVTLVDGINTFRAVGFSRDRTESNPYELVVKLAAPSKDVSLYVFATGINRYKNPALNLNYAEPDARGIVNFFKQKGNSLFKKVTLIDLYNNQATKQGIISKLKQLHDTQPQDAILIYLAGHGESVDNKWYFIPYELTYPEREEDVKNKGISSDELSEYIKDIKAQKILVLIDACKSGAVLIAFRGFEDRKALAQLSRSTGVHIVAASTEDQFAAEVKDLGHGVFTYTILEGLGGKAAGKEKSVTVRKLMGYVEEQLPEITRKYKQEAQYPVIDSRGMDFPLVIAK